MYYARETSLHPEEGDAVQGSERKSMSCRAMRLQSVHNTGMHKHCECIFKHGKNAHHLILHSSCNPVNLTQVHSARAASSFLMVVDADKV